MLVIRIVFVLLRLSFVLLMWFGKGNKISIYTQFVPLVYLFLVGAQFFCIEYFAIDSRGFIKKFNFYESYRNYFSIFFIFVSLATNLHYLCNFLLTAPIYLSLVIYVQIQKE